MKQPKRPLIASYKLHQEFIIYLLTLDYIVLCRCDVGTFSCMGTSNL